MEFSYTAATSTGATRAGTLEAQSAREVIATLKAQGLIVLSVQARERRRAGLKGFRARLVKIGSADRVLLARHLALMLRAGLPIDRALEILGVQARSSGMKKIFQELLTLVQRGESLGSALARYPTIFPPIFITVVRWGEVGGSLVESLEHLAAQLEKDHELRVKVRGAFIYPVIVIGATVVLGVIMAVFILPRLVVLFEAFQVALPLSTRVFLAVAKFFLRYGLIALPISLVLAVVSVLLIRSKFLRPFLHRAVLKVPVFGPLVSQVNLARFDRILGSLMSSGIPIVDALGITAESLGNVQYQRVLAQILRTAREGFPIGRETTKSKLFPPIQSQMIVVGEATGRLSEVLLYLADFTERDIDTRTKNLATAVEPMLLIFIGFIVGGVAIAVITPIYQLTGSLTK